MVKRYNLMVAPNGARLTQSDHKQLPITADEIAKTAKACFAEGAGTLHLHIRDDDQKHSLDAQRYRETISRVKSVVPEMKIQITTEAVGIFDVAAQIKCIIETKPDALSMSVREFSHEPELTQIAYSSANQLGAEIEHIVYTPADIEMLLDHYVTGVIPKSERRILCVLGRYTQGQVSEPTDLDPFLDAIKGQNFSWSVCAFGKNEQSCLLYALEKGGNIRIGFENNRLMPNGEPFTDNQSSVRAFVKAAAIAGYHPRKAPQ